ncbi:hypothetical protein EVAR_52266_1 [Eumeta japonica]|uniref:Uncharacterized protein n=1 Tax=Eumeta variegata TaxID=151549 RepID=A0A4C1YPT4_EUMVA|nr:hypothetical protein EVAR_52266_1 [Eumeta japonica]
MKVVPKSVLIETRRVTAPTLCNKAERQWNHILYKGCHELESTSTRDTCLPSPLLKFSAIFDSGLLRDRLYPPGTHCLSPRPSPGHQFRSVVLIFYGVFYAVLAALFAVCMCALHYSLDPSSPRWKLDRSLIGVNPGVALRPRAADFGPRIEYDAGASAHRHYAAQLDSFLSGNHDDALHV